MSAEIWGWWRVRLGSRCAMRYPVPLLFLNLLTLLQGTICAFPLLYSPFCSAPLHSGTGRRPERQTTCRMILVREIARNVVSYRVPVQYRAPPSLLKPRREPSARTSFVPRVPPCAGCCSVAQSQLIDRARRHCCHLPQRRCWTASKDGSAAIAATVACDTLTGSSRLCHDIVCVGAAAGNFGPAS